MSYNLTKQDIIELLLLPTFNSACLIGFDMFIEGKSQQLALQDATYMFSSSLATEVLDKLAVDKLVDKFGYDGVTQIMSLAGRSVVNSLIYQGLYDRFYYNVYKDNYPNYVRDPKLTYAIGATAGLTKIIANPLMGFITGLQIL